MKKLLAVILCIAALFSLCACTDMRKYTFDGFSVQLPRTFKESEKGRYDLYLSDGDVFVWTIKDGFENEDGMDLWSLEGYMDVLYVLNGTQSPTPITVEDGIIYFEYSALNESKAKNFTYLTTAFKASDAFYTVQFVCEDLEYEVYKPQFMEWAKTIKVR